MSETVKWFSPLLGPAKAGPLLFLKGVVDMKNNLLTVYHCNDIVRVYHCDDIGGKLNDPRTTQNPTPGYSRRGASA